MRKSIILLVALVCLPFLLLSHFTWVSGNAAKRQVRVGHGHLFPQGEERLDPQKVILRLVAGNGQQYQLLSSTAGQELLASYGPDIPAPVWAALTLKPVIYTKTSSGVKIGPRSNFSAVVDSFRLLRFGQFLFTLAQGLVSCQNEAEITVRPESDGFRLIFLYHGQALPGVEFVWLGAGDTKEKSIGRTDSAGQVLFRPSRPGRYLVVASCRLPVQHADYLAEVLEVSLLADWTAAK